MRTAPLCLLALCACGGGSKDGVSGSPDPVSLRIATFNVSMYRSQPGALATDLADPNNEHALGVAALVGSVDPDVILLNEFDHDDSGAAVQALIANFLPGYSYFFAPPVNTGVPSGLDLDDDGVVTTAPGSAAYGGDCWGYGVFPGQYGLVVLSKYPIDLDATRTFQNFLWSDQHGADIPTPFYDTTEALALRLSSKTHADVAIDVDGQRLQVLVSHPTPPAFDGAEDRNGRRNVDEIRFWADYLDGDAADYHIDDAGLRGGIAPGPFVVLGDLNADPNDGENQAGIRALLNHPRVNDAATPTSSGAIEASAKQAGVNATHLGDPSSDTADFDDNDVGNLRLDYALASTELQVDWTAVLWPAEGEPLFEYVGNRFPPIVSDHRMVWMDVTFRP